MANKGQAGPVIATWMSQEEQVKGEVTRDFESNLQAAKDRASEAISENAIPARYHGPVTKYFETVGQPDDHERPPAGAPGISGPKQSLVIPNERSESRNLAVRVTARPISRRDLSTRLGVTTKRDPPEDPGIPSAPPATSSSETRPL